MKSVEKKIKIIQADLAEKVDKAFPHAPEAETPRVAFNRLVAKYRASGKKAQDFVRSDASKMGYMIKLGWQCGKSSQETMEELGIKAGSTSQDYKAFIAVREALRTQVTEWDTSDIYQKFCERARGIIRNLEYQAQLIEKMWQEEERARQEDETYVMKQPYSREHIVLWDMIFKMEARILEIGVEMNVIGKKGDDKTINFVTTTSLMPEARGGEGGFQELPSSPVSQMLEDMSTKRKEELVNRRNDAIHREGIREAILDQRRDSLFGKDDE